MYDCGKLINKKISRWSLGPIPFNRSLSVMRGNRIARERGHRNDRKKNFIAFILRCDEMPAVTIAMSKGSSIVMLYGAPYDWKEITRNFLSQSFTQRDIIKNKWSSLLIYHRSNAFIWMRIAHDEIPKYYSLDALNIGSGCMLRRLFRKK